MFAIPARDTRAAYRGKFNTERYQNVKYKNSPYYKAAKLWDTLGANIIDSSTVGELKKHLKVLYAQLDENYYI